MNDTSLSDDLVKLVRYSIVSVKRDQEEILFQDEVLVTDDMTADGFASWQIAAYFQHDDHRDFPHEDKKYLRVCYRVLCRWPREPLRYEGRQLDVLRGIRDAILGRGGGGAGAEEPPPPSSSPALGGDEEAVLGALEGLGGTASTGELTAASSLSRYRVTNALKALIDAGRVRREGTGFETHYVVEE